MSKNLSQPNKESVLALALGLMMLAGIVVNGLVLVKGFISVYIEGAEKSTSKALDITVVESALREIGE